MIITRTPLRISLVGGGTDLPNFYNRHPGAVVSFAINRYVWVMVNRKFDGRIRVSYSKTENVDSPGELEHDLIREAMRWIGAKGLEIVTVADVPGEGTGLGSSSSMLVGLVKALLLNFSKENPDARKYAESAEYIARAACNIEQGLHKDVGKQDQYAASYGGIHKFIFSPEKVTSIPIVLSKENQEKIENRLMLMWLDKVRDSGSILASHNKSFKQGTEGLSAGRQMASLADGLTEELSKGNVDCLGEFLHENWKLKRELGRGITDSEIDSLYHRARLAGAKGGKVCGAGGGGFLLLYAPVEKHPEIRKRIGLRQMKFNIDPFGSRLIYKNGSNP